MDYKYTLKEFCSLTFHQISCILDTINRRRVNDKSEEREFQASLKGIKLKMPRLTPRSKMLEKAKEQEGQFEGEKADLADKVMREALERKRKEKAGEQVTD